MIRFLGVLADLGKNDGSSPVLKPAFLGQVCLSFLFVVKILQLFFGLFLSLDVGLIID